MSTENENKTEIAIYEEIRKNTELATQEDLKVPMSMVFGHGTVGKNSLFISRDTKKKKIAIKTSLIQCKTLNFSPKLSVPRVTYFFKIEKYSSL